MFHFLFTSYLSCCPKDTGGLRGVVTLGRKQLCSCGHLHMVTLALGFPGGSDNKESACNAGDLGGEDPLEEGLPMQEMQAPGSGKIPWRREWQPTPVLLPGEFHGWRSLAGYGPWAHKESDTTERLTLHFGIFTT